MLSVEDFDKAARTVCCRYNNVIVIIFVGDFVLGCECG